MYRIRQYFNKQLLLKRKQQQQQQQQHRHFTHKDDNDSEFIGCIPVDKIEKRFMRSSGPGGQNVNMVNTKCQIRFNLNEADWLSPKIQEIFRKRFVRLLNKQHDVVISSDKSRIQAENQEDCFKKLHAMLLECNKELLDNRPPTDQDKAVMDNRMRRAAQRRLYAKRIHSEKKKNRDPYEFI
ncbi:unnamed protein product [Cercopithifilaria johnstoni]|uniref:Large ribosomal subunit protein mL62 n=1 Tax=Cercopithifilaria johnstoni TaxID=2874296 RepID=A0A8J2M2J3_9BILA|nr:unnamed protein product [Cercopithifilaria johnstoni]